MYKRILTLANFRKALGFSLALAGPPDGPPGPARPDPATSHAIGKMAGLLFVRAANEGRTVIEMFPREKITGDFDVLADRLLGNAKPEGNVRSGFRFGSRLREQPIRA